MFLLRAAGRLLRRLLVIVIAEQVVLRLVRRWVHFPAPPFVTVFLNSRLRAAMQPPALVLGWMGLQPGMQVAEVGPGGGAFTLEAARLVGPAGRVYAFDIQPAMIARLDQRVADAGLANVTTQVASAYELPLPDASVDLLYLVTVLAEIPDRPRALAEFRRVIRPGGRLAVAEFLPDPDYPRPRTVIGWCGRAGFLFERHRGGLLHYVVLCGRPHSVG